MADRIVLVARRVSGKLWKPDLRQHDADIDTVVATMTERAKDGKAGDLGYEVLEVEVVRRIHIQPRITAVDVTEEGEAG